MRKTVPAATVAALVAAGLALSAPPGLAALPAWHPARLAHVGDARQLVVVTGNAQTSSHGTLRAFEYGADHMWRERFPAMAARNGWGGWAVASRRTQGDGTSPQGTFPITTAFGLRPDPGTKLPYRHADGNDRWVGDQRDAKTYNLFQPSTSAGRTWRLGHAERLADYPIQYEFAAVIDFNRPAPATVRFDEARHQYITSRPADVRRGSAIFLHVNGAGPTAGCISLRRADLLTILHWVDPSLRPRIVMAPLAEIGRA